MYCVCYDCRFDSSASSPCLSLAEKWSGAAPPTATTEFDSLTSSQKQEFLNQLLLIKVIINYYNCILYYYSNTHTYIQEPLPIDKLSKMEKLYKLNSCTNDEITFRYEDTPPYRYPPIDIIHV